MSNVANLHEADFEDDDTVIDGTVEQDDEGLDVEQALPLQDTLLHTLNTVGIDELENFIEQKMISVIGLRDERQVLQDKIKTKTGKVTDILNEMQTKGLNKKAVQAALQYLTMSDKDRSAFDYTLKLVRKAVGEPMQIDLFKE